MPSANPELRTSRESLGKDRVKLRVEVAESRFKPAVDAAYRRWAQEISVPGFRKGKVPRQMIDARVGADAVRDEALRDALPDLYREALAAEGLEPIAPPDVEVVEPVPGSPVVFEATVDLRPEVVVPDPSTISVEAPSSGVTDEEMQEQLDRLRDRFAELETVGREARRGDFALIDLKGYQHDQPVEGAGAPDLLYEIGSQTGPPKLDTELEGNRPGAILKFTDVMPPGSGELAGREISFTVLIKEIKAKSLPALDDDFAKTVGEFDSLEALKDDLRTRLEELKEGMVEDEIRARVLSALVDAADLEAPERLVDDEANHRLQHFQEDVKRAGLTMAAYEEHSGMTELEIRRDLREQAARGVKAELLLEQIARDLGIEVTQEDIGQELAIAAARSQRDPKELAEQVIQAGQLPSLAADIMRRKALESVVESVEVVGRPQKASGDQAEEPEATPDE